MFSRTRTAASPIRCALRALRDPSLVDGAGPVVDGCCADHGMPRRGHDTAGARRLVNGLLFARSS
ncbi:MAG: hypothetical protein JWM90_2585 [Thermoleophilia bacterium]|nr:hypothetical protein [Thermoleophilia bacterium]